MSSGSFEDAKKIKKISFEILDILKRENLSVSHAQDVIRNVNQAIDNMLSFVPIPDYKAFACPNCKALEILIKSEPPPNFCGQCGQKDPLGLEAGFSG